MEHIFPFHISFSFGMNGLGHTIAGISQRPATHTNRVLSSSFGFGHGNTADVSVAFFAFLSFNFIRVERPSCSTTTSESATVLELNILTEICVFFSPCADIMQCSSYAWKDGFGLCYHRSRYGDGYFWAAVRLIVPATVDWTLNDVNEFESRFDFTMVCVGVFAACW